MEASSQKYLEVLQASKIQPRKGNGTKWVSSVYGSGEPRMAELKASYWKENMVKPVLFYEALTSALTQAPNEDPFDCVIEVGPRPSLTSHVKAIMDEMKIPFLPYSGLLNRQKDDREAFSDFLGWMWTLFSGATDHIRQFAVSSARPDLVHHRLLDPPAYPWDHSQIFYRESRISRQYHFKTQQPHELLGVRTRDDNKFTLRWRNMLKYEHLPWVKHHSFQGQALLPASAYLIMALDAAKVVLNSRNASIVELHNLKFSSGIVLEPDADVEVLFSLTVEHESFEEIKASFTLTSTQANGNIDMKKNFTGSMTVILEEPSADVFPRRAQGQPETVRASEQGFYKMMAETGLFYTGPFKGLQELRRRFNFSTAVVKRHHEEDTTSLRISPATLDTCLQTAFVTISSPGDNSIWTSFLPVDIESVRFNLAICERQNIHDFLYVDAYLTKESPITENTGASFTADIEIYNESGEMEIQIQGLTVGSWGTTKPEQDHELYLTTTFELDCDFEIVSSRQFTDPCPHACKLLLDSCFRVAAFYARQALGGLDKTHLPSVLRLYQDTEESIKKFVNNSPYSTILNLVSHMDYGQLEVFDAELSHFIREVVHIVALQQHLTRIIKQIAHKYARLNVLALTDPSLSLTQHILDGLGDSFMSYHLGTKPEEKLADRRPFCDMLGKKIKVAKFDLYSLLGEQDTVTYDLAILTTSVSKPHVATTALDTLKRVMRPGGFLVLVHVPDDLINLLEGRFWVRYRNGDLHWPETPSWEDWFVALQACGFSETIKNSTQVSSKGLAIMIRHNEAESKKVLIQPACDLTRRKTGRLLIVGGKKVHTTRIACRIASVLTVHFADIDHFDDFDSVVVSSEVSAVIILADMDQPIISTMTEKSMQVLKQLFRPNMTIIWVTQDALVRNPEHAASFGFARTLAAETPGVCLRMIDMDNQMDYEQVCAAVGNEIVSCLLQLDFKSLAEGNASTQPMLWVTEPEIHYRSGCPWIPRVVPWKEGNERVNAPRRVIVKEVNTLEKVVSISPSGSKTNNRLFSAHIVRDVNKQVPSMLVVFETLFSTAEPMTLNIGRKEFSAYMCLVRNLADTRRCLVFSTTNSSHIVVSADPRHNEVVAWAEIPIDRANSNDEACFALIVRYIAADAIMKKIKRSHAIIFEPDKLLAECLKELTDGQNVELTVCSQDPEIASSKNYAVHYGMSSRQIRVLLSPARAQHITVVNLLPESHPFTKKLKQALPAGCTYFGRSQLFADFEGPEMLAKKLADDDVSAAKVGGICIKDWKWFETVVHKVEAIKSAPTWSAPVSVPQLLQLTATTLPLFKTINWKAECLIPCIVKPVIGTQLLRPDRTYVIVGLTRDFGQSLCTLFVQQGARNFVLSSRNIPEKLPNWVHHMPQGVKVVFERLDVTDLKQVKQYKTKLFSHYKLPPVGGVVNGAMVLDDRVFSEMSIETWHRVLRPKTVGSYNLHSVFNEPDMDFFIMTSSFAAIGGHAGQSNYSSANMYMNGLAALRRSQGLPGSVLNIGVIYGLGFLHREKDELYQGLEREGYPPISERDIHHMFLEAIVAGKPIPGQDVVKCEQIYDIVTGLRRFDPADRYLHWHFDPRFSHLFRVAETDEECVSGGVDGKEHQPSLKELVNMASDKQEVVKLLVDGIVTRLQCQLHLAEGSISGDHTISELGVDSLAAVEIRTWIWKTLGYDVAVMKLLSGVTIRALCMDIAGAVMKAREEIQ
ncbi:polyketide synthase-like protein [Thermochaetoides thermophila DSM 1495]|uniref:Polyketide synthase-like protein n=1 Tax=Chaetomium thermophilum (strain DSM 1495 / CBS 144.50 / IMI 039719) TaxID=759272 RepID=G0S334_CHATD|nr:polyketide synthase-like protein [Thermochaetoides thermophila DSM 1495]EGS22417.1 polyketide synthase-like protein [Thermochaetoides thermophila DSM 1495]